MEKTSRGLTSSAVRGGENCGGNKGGGLCSLGIFKMYFANSEK